MNENSKRWGLLRLTILNPLMWDTVLHAALELVYPLILNICMNRLKNCNKYERYRLLQMNSESNANGRCRSQFARHIDDKYMHEEIEDS